MIRPIKLFELYNQINWELHSRILYLHSNTGNITNDTIIVLDPSLNDVFWYLYIKHSLEELEADELAILMSELDQLIISTPITFDQHLNLINPFCKRTVRYNRIVKFESMRHGRS